MKLIRNCFFLLCIILSACADHKKAESEEALQFCIPDSLIPMLKFGKVQYEDVTHELSLYGKISSDQERVIKIYPLAGGYIQNIKVELGDFIKKGQVLATMVSSDVVNLRKDLIAAEANMGIAKRNMDAAKDMYESGIVSERDYVATTKEYQKAASEVSRDKELMRLYSGGDSQQEYIIKSPIDGFLVEKNVNSNMQVRADNGQNLFTISDLKDVWVIANVYETDIDKVKLGYPAIVTTLTYPDKKFLGEVDKIYNTLDASTRSMKIRVKLTNPDYLLKPEMFANVELVYKENHKMITVPSKGLIFDNSRNYVMIYKSRCNVLTKEIKVTNNVAGKAYIDGHSLEPGEVVITDYNLLVYDAIND